MLHALYRSLRLLIVLSCTRILRPPENHIKDLVGSGSNTVSFLKNRLREVPHFPSGIVDRAKSERSFLYRHGKIAREEVGPTDHLLVGRSNEFDN